MKQNIELSVLNLLVSYDNQERVEKSIKQAQEEAVAALRTKTLNNDFCSTKRIKRMLTIKTTNYNTLCGALNCFSNCHINCALPKLFDKEDCCAMRGGNYCRCGHLYSSHYHNEVRFKEEVYDKEYVDKDMQSRFKEAETMEQRASILKKELEDHLRESEDKKKVLSEQLLAKISEFQELGINRNYAKLIENQLAVIELRLQGTTGSEDKHLRKTKQELEKKLKIVLEAVKK